MSVTSLKLPHELKERIQSLVTGTGRSAHAFMVEAIERAAQAEELRRRFGEDAAAAALVLFGRRRIAVNDDVGAA